MATFEEFNERIRRISEPTQFNAIWLRASGYCEYCGEDLFGSHAVHRGAEGDHILPKSKYPLLINKLNNYAMACASCHKLKGSRFNPGSGQVRWQQAIDITDQEREGLIDVVKARLSPKRSEQLVDMQRARDYICRHFPKDCP